MTTIPTTTADAVLDVLVSRIKRIIPAYAPRRDESWRPVGNGKRVDASSRILRQFEIILGAQTETPDGAYGGGVQYQCSCTIRVGYPLSSQQRDRFVGADGQDLTAMLVRLHADLDGMFPVAVQGRETQLLTISNLIDKEHGYVVDFNVAPGLSFMASDQVAFAPEI